MFKPGFTFNLGVLITCCLAAASAAASVCDGPPEVREVTIASIKAFIRSKQMTVLTFARYSGASYEGPGAMMEHASRVLDGQDPEKVLINIGDTAEGIGAVYEIARQKGFTTMGIVSVLARDERVALSGCVDYVFHIKDNSWGGKVPGTNLLSLASTAIVEISTSFIAIGGGDVARDEMLAARQAGKPVVFMPADMNHQIAREKAQKKGQAEPTDFLCSAPCALAECYYLHRPSTPALACGLSGRLGSTIAGVGIALPFTRLRLLGCGRGNEIRNSNARSGS